MLKYLDQRDINIVGHHGLMRFLDDILRIRCAIQQYVQHYYQRKMVDGTMTIIPSINFMLQDVFGFIDDSTYQILTPFSGSHNGYEGSTCKAEYADAQQAFYSGYVKDHGMKVETLFFAKWSLNSIWSRVCLTKCSGRACNEQSQ